MSDESWAVLQDIYMERIAELEAARDALWEKCKMYQEELRLLKTGAVR